MLFFEKCIPHRIQQSFLIFESASLFGEKRIKGCRRWKRTRRMFHMHVWWLLTWGWMAGDCRVCDAALAWYSCSGGQVTRLTPANKPQMLEENKEAWIWTNKCRDEIISKVAKSSRKECKTNENRREREKCVAQNYCLSRVMGNVIILTTDFHTKGRNFLFFFIKFSLYLNMVLFVVVCTLHSGGKQVHKKPKCTRKTNRFFPLSCVCK